MRRLLMTHTNIVTGNILDIFLKTRVSAPAISGQYSNYISRQVRPKKATKGIQIKREDIKLFADDVILQTVLRNSQKNFLELIN